MPQSCLTSYSSLFPRAAIPRLYTDRRAFLPRGLRDRFPGLLLRETFINRILYADSVLAACYLRQVT